MKKYILLSLLFLAINIFSLDLIKEVKLENIQGCKISDKNFLTYPNFNYNIKNKLLVAEIRTLWDNNNDKKINYPDNFYGVYVFGEKGKNIGKLGKFNSRDNDGFMRACCININSDNIYFEDGYDYRHRKVLIFSAKKPFKFLYRITDPEEKLQDGNIHFLWNGYAFADQTDDFIHKNGILYTDKFMRTAYGEIAQIEPGKKIIVTGKKICSYKKYSDILWGDGVALKNKFIQHYTEDYKYSPIYYINAIMFFNARLHQFIPNGNDTLFVVNDFGMDIRQYNGDVALVDSFYIGDIYMKPRLKELKKLKNAIRKHFHGKRGEFINKYYICSKLNGALYDKKNNNMIMVYNLKKYFLKHTKLPEAKAYLLIYSLDKRKTVSDFIPIDFYPIQFDNEKRELIGIQERDENLYLQFYKWE